MASRIGLFLGQKLLATRSIPQQRFFAGKMRLLSTEGSAAGKIVNGEAFKAIKEGCDTGRYCNCKGVEKELKKMNETLDSMRSTAVTAGCVVGSVAAGVFIAESL
jgi:hypothetical protein